MGDREPDFRKLFEHSVEVLLVLLPDAPRYTMVAATDARLEATHTTREGTIGKSLFEIFPDNPDDPAATGASNLRASLDRVVATRAADTMAVQRYDIRGPDGSFQSKYWSPRNSPILDATGEVLYILHRVEDVTELVHATELGEELRGRNSAMQREVLRRSQELSVALGELRQVNTKLGELDRAKTAFFSNVSHEFRTPLTLMLGPLQDALAKPELALVGSDLGLVHRSALRLLRLVNTLLDFSRLESGGLKPTFEPTDLASLTAALAGSFQSLVESAGMTLTVECPPLEGVAYVDPARWEHIVLNLVSNAFKFTLAGGIAVRLRQHGETAELCVSDTGTGIAEAERGRIFERFHRVEGAVGRSYEGTGIGLAMVRELTVLHGGTIHVESEVGQGTTFKVEIPLGSAHLPADRIASPTRPDVRRAAAPFVLEASQWLGEDPPGDASETPPKARGRERILVVDDNADMRDYLVRTLRPHWEVTSARDGERALASIRESPPDLVLSDVMMPVMDGFSLLRALRRSASTRHIPVILLSARTGEGATVEGLEQGADDYLHKPFSLQELLARVRTQLDAARSRTSALRASETRFQRLSESGIIGIVVANAAGAILEANAAFLDLVGYTQADLLAGKLTTETLLLPAGGETHRATNEASVAMERIYLRKNGDQVPAFVVVAPLEDGETISISLDLSERKSLEEQFRQAQKMDAVGRLAGGIAHDFNNVLSVILSYAEIIRGSLREDDPSRADAEEIRQAGLRAATLTKQLLAFSRQQVLDRKILSINDVLTGIEKMLARLLGADVTLTTLPANDLWNVKADAGQLEQILMNLAVNARDAMPDGGKLTLSTANVELDEEYARAHPEVTAGPYVMLSVTDTGEGMTRETRARIFEPFFTTKERGKGTGLGLATVFGIVKQSGGHIWVYSEQHVGTTFRVYFPRATGAASPPRVERPAQTMDRGSGTILLVEDDDQVRALAVGILRRNGYVVLECSNGGEALLIAEQHAAKIHLLLTDVILPRLGGRLIAERLSAKRPEMKVLYMSGYTDDAILQHGILEAGVPYLQKPITPARLIHEVQTVLGQT